MLSDRSPAIAHLIQNLFIIFLSLWFLPLDTTVLFSSYVYSLLRPIHKKTKGDPSDYGPRRTVLVTGLSMTKALTIVRLVAQHPSRPRVIGADFSPIASGLFSRYLAASHRLAPPSAHAGPDAYILDLHSIIELEKVDIWISCSGVASAVDDAVAREAIERTSNCKCVQFDVQVTEQLHEKSKFMECTKSLGLPIPDTYTVSSRQAAERIFGQLQSSSSPNKFIMKPTGIDDKYRADMTLLPLETTAQTQKHLAKLPISPENPWIIQQFINGKEFCTHALVVEGQVRAFVACPSSDLLMHYVAMPPATALSKAMLSFTEQFASRLDRRMAISHNETLGNSRRPNGERRRHFTGHLSFDFLVSKEDVSKRNPEEIKLYPIECNPRAHTAVALFSNTPALAEAYLDLVRDETSAVPLQNDSDKPTWQRSISPVAPYKYHWVGHDLVELLVLPYLAFLRHPSFSRLHNLFGKGLRFEEYLLRWKDGTFSVHDPLPWWVLYHIYWPWRCLQMMWHGKKWSRLNVSTGKMFEC